jgi:hypothetical protein
MASIVLPNGRQRKVGPPPNRWRATDTIDRIGSPAMPQINAIVGLRAAIGASAWLAPNLSGRLFGLNPSANPQLPYVGRLFAIRDVALAAGLAQSSGESRRLWLQLGVLCDAADALAGLLAGRGGQLSKVSTALVTGPAVMGLGLGVAALRAGDAVE